jgi:hypothetical protein
MNEEKGAFFQSDGQDFATLRVKDGNSAPLLVRGCVTPIKVRIAQHETFEEVD